MSGKKKEKFRISIGLACNADGSERLGPIFIGRARKPRCFKTQTPEQRGFYYRNNKKAWMTMDIFEEYVAQLINIDVVSSNLSFRWIKKLDLQMKQQKRHICLFVDNFSGHNIAYEPSNIDLEFFEPNMTSHIQPCDAGIIRCFKALYRHKFCMRAINLDEAGEQNIYKVDLLSAMSMAKEAWGAVTSKTIKHCWEHTQIQPLVYFIS